MAGKSKGAKNKAKAAATAKTESPGTGCHACNFCGEVCRQCAEPATGCECKRFEPVQCPTCMPVATENVGKEPSQQPAEEAEPVADIAADADGQTYPIGDERPAAGEEPATTEQIAEAISEWTEGQMEAGKDAAVERGDMLEGDGATDSSETVFGLPATVSAQPAGRDAELESLVEQSVKRRMERLKTGNRRRHHTKQLSVRVLTGILKAGEAAAAGGADGFFGRWCRNDLMAWEALMDAAEWAQEELNAREFRRLKRESLKAQQNTAAAAL